MKILFTFLIIQFLLLTIRSERCGDEDYNPNQDFCCQAKGKFKVCRKGQGCWLNGGNLYCYDYNKPYTKPS
jgi:hypothetical protein